MTNPRAFALGATAASWLILACTLLPRVLFRRTLLYPHPKEH